MADVLKSNLKATKDASITINASGTDYNLSIFLYNAHGEVRFIDSSSFEGITFETLHTTPFLIGTLTLADIDAGHSFNKVDFSNIPDAKVMSEVNSYGDGQEFLRVKITSKSSFQKACDYTDEVLMDKYFTTKSVKNTIQDNKKQVIYYFIDIIYTHFQNKRKEWSTDFLRDRQKTNKNCWGCTPVNSGKALKHLLKYFTDDPNVIDEDVWDDGQGSVYYTLPAGEPALTAINEILKTYVSSDESGGILTYYNGRFQLTSMRQHINKVYKTVHKPNEQAVVIELGSNFAGALKIQTNDNRQTYTNKQSIDLLGPKFPYIPISLKNITFTDIQPDATITKLDKKEVTHYDLNNKEITIYGAQGTLGAVQSKTSTDGWPDGDDNQLNIDDNNVFSESKTRIFKVSDKNSASHYGTIKLQRQLLDHLTKANFSMPGNIEMSANKFLYMTMDLKVKNKFANKVPGFWYITRNITSIKKGEWASNIVCVKLDKPKT